MSKKNDQAEQRPEKKKTDAQIILEEWERQNAENSDNTATVRVVPEKSNNFEKRTKQFFDAVDELFNELLARILTILEALGVMTTGQRDLPIEQRKEEAMKRLIKDVVRDIQNRIKDEYPNYKELK